MKNRSSIVLDPKAFEEIVDEFAREAPRLLARHPKTLHLSDQLQQDLQAALQHFQFTVAVVGQMSSGKSMLLNTLLDTTVLPVGVTATTATVNWLWHGIDEECEHFDVHRREDRIERESLENIDNWRADRGYTDANVEATKYLKFFVNSPFLKEANFIDTPGMRSNSPEHEEATRALISDKLNEDTLKYGGLASAILYVGSNVGTSHTLDFLEECGMKMRLPGSEPENSIFVFQRWDTKGGVSEDPIAIADKHQKVLEAQFEEHVSEVLPTCPPLAIAAKYIEDLDIWDRLAEIGASTTPDHMQTLLDLAKIVISTTPDCLQKQLCLEKKARPLSQEDFSRLQTRAMGVGDIRARIMEVISPDEFSPFPYWDIIRFSIRVAHARRIDDGNVLRKTVDAASGLEKLKRVLQTRFIDHGHRLFASRILAKVVAPCDDAQRILSEITRHRTVKINNARHILENRPFRGASALHSLRGFLKEEAESLEHEIAYAKSLEGEIHEIQKLANRYQEDFDNDITHLKTLETEGVKEALDASDRAFLKRLFGGEGQLIRQRLGLPPQCDLTLKIKDQVEVWAECWNDRAHKAKALGQKGLTEVCEHARNRLSDIKTYIEDLHDLDEKVIV